MVAVLLLGGPSAAQLVQITPDQQRVPLDAELRFWASLGPVPGPALAAFQTGQFGRNKQVISHGLNHAPEMWFATELRNDSFDDGRAGDPFVLVFDAPAVVGYRLFLVREDGLTENLVDFSSYDPFDPAIHTVNRLRSPDFVLAPGEQVTLLAHLQLGLAHGFTATLYRPDTLISDSLGWTATLTAFYAFCFSCLVIAFGFQAAMKSRVGMIYIVMFLLFLTALALSDSLLFRFLVPNRPDLHRYLSYSVFFLLAASLCAFVSEGLRVPGHPRGRLSRIMLGLSVFAILALGMAIWLDAGWSIYIAFVLCGLGLAVNIFLPNSFRTSEDNPNVGIRLVSTIAMLSAAFVMVWSVMGWNTEWLSQRAALKIAYMFLMLTAMSFLTGNLIVLRLRHLAAVEARVQALEQEAERSRQLLETERAYVRARETAATRQRQLATASHDIKQPLMSLRTTFDAISAGMDDTVRQRLNESFRYLETLSRDFVDGTVEPDDQSDAAQEAGDREEAPEVYSVAVPLGTVQQMFSDEAAAKGLSLRVVETSVQTTAPPIALMRILSNLVSNAVKYTDQGGVLVGLRREGPQIWVCDTGQGMTDAELETFQQAYSKGDQSTGHGLGLSVCFELAREHDMTLVVTSAPGQGTVFALSLAQHVPAAHSTINAT